MRRPLNWWLVASIALVSACEKAADKSAESSPAASPDSSPAGPVAGPVAIVTVIYNHPKDTAAFEKYYRDVHLPLVSSNQAEIGFVKADLTRFQNNLDGSKPGYYRQAELYFPSMDALKKGTATAGFKKVADDLANFADGGLSGLIAVETNEPATVTADEPMAIVTVLYKPPTDAAAFEQYYADTHLPLVTAGQPEIGFVKADLTKFESALDGTPAPLYRQAELYFKSMADLKKGIATPAFKKVSDDLAKFATGGLVGMTAIETK